MTPYSITIDVSHIEFCPGPCNSKIPENKSIYIDEDQYNLFKPYSGGRYSCMSYPFGKYMLSLTNVRICPDCNSRHGEFWSEEAFERLEEDAITIIKKLDIDLSLYKKKHIILDGPAFNTNTLTEAIVGKEEAKKYNSEDEEYLDEYVEFIRPYDYDHHLEAGVDIKD